MAERPVYYLLIAGKGYLEYWPTLDADRKAESQRIASVFVDMKFDDWDRTSWSGAGVPPDVAQIAEWVAAAEYIERSFGTNTPGSTSLDQVDMLMTKATKWADEASARGWVLGPKGDRQFARDRVGGKSGKTIRAVR